MASTVTSTAPPSVQTEGQKDNGDPGQIGMDGSGCALAADLDEATIKRLGGLIKVCTSMQCHSAARFSSLIYRP